MSRAAEMTVTRGDPITLALELESGDPAGIAVVSDLKPTSGLTTPAEDVAAVASFTATFVPAEGADRPRWDLSINAAASAELLPGQYVADARLSLDGEQVKTSPPVFIRITQGVTQ